MNTSNDLFYLLASLIGLGLIVSLAVLIASSARCRNISWCSMCRGRDPDRFIIEETDLLNNRGAIV